MDISGFIRANVHYAEWVGAIGTIGVLWWAWHESTSAGRQRARAVLSVAWGSAYPMMNFWERALSDMLSQPMIIAPRIQRLQDHRGTALNEARLLAISPVEMPTHETLLAFMTLQDSVVRVRQSLDDAIARLEHDDLARATEAARRMGPALGTIADEINRLAPPKGMARVRNWMRRRGWMKPANEPQLRHGSDFPTKS